MTIAYGQGGAENEERKEDSVVAKPSVQGEQAAIGRQ